MADSKDDHDVADGSCFPLAFRQSIVRDTNVFTGQFRKVDRNGDARILPPLSQAYAESDSSMSDRRAGQGENSRTRMAGCAVALTGLRLAGVQPAVELPKQNLFNRSDARR
jgi:hypothetical protein